MGWLWKNPYEQAHATTVAVRHILYTAEDVKPDPMHNLPKEIDAARHILDTPDSWRPKIVDTAIRRYMERAVALLKEIQCSTSATEKKT
jgi:hypothetical protein